MSVKDYLRASAFDFLLCLVIAIGLGYINCGAFFVDASLQNSPVALALSCAVPLVLLFAAAFSTRTIVPGAIATAVVLVIAIIAAGAIGGSANIFDDTAGNPVVFIIVMFLSSAATFLLTRKRWMPRAFFLVAVLDMAFVEFMYKDGHWAALVAVIIAAGAMAVYRNYRANLREASSTKVSFTAAFSVGTVFSVVLAALACALFFGVIAPLNPPAQEIKIFTRYVNYEQVEMTGVGDTALTQDPDKASATTTDQTQDSTDDSDGDNENDVNATMKPSDAPSDGSQADQSDQGDNVLQQMFNYLMENPPLMALFILLVLVVLALPFVIKQMLRRRWLAKTCSLPPDQAMKRFFMFFMRKFRILKVRKHDEQTLAEFVDATKGTLEPFANNDRNVEFADVARIYSKVVYGHAQPSEDEMTQVESFYKGFRRAFAELSGKLKYCLRYWRV